MLLSDKMLRNAFTLSCLKNPFFLCIYTLSTESTVSAIDCDPRNPVRILRFNSEHFGSEQHFLEAMLFPLQKCGSCPNRKNFPMPHSIQGDYYFWVTFEVTTPLWGYCVLSKNWLEPNSKPPYQVKSVKISDTHDIYLSI